MGQVWLSFGSVLVQFWLSADAGAYAAACAGACAGGCKTNACPCRPVFAFAQELCIPAGQAGGCRLEWVGLTGDWRPGNQVGGARGGVSQN